MEIKTLYRFKREDGGITVSPIKPDCEHTELVRLIADEDKAITKDGINTFSAIDTTQDDAMWWAEIPAPARSINS